MEAAIRFSQNSYSDGDDQKFLRVDVIGKSFQLCKITKASKTSTRYETVHSSTKVPPFRAFDWHPTKECLIAVGQSGGEATLLNIEDGKQDSISFSVRSQRLCNAVTLSSQNLIAVGLDKVRTDFCLNIWDFNQRLPTASSRSFSKSHADPIHKLAGGEPISSLKFFNSAPQLLLAGVKGQFVRLYDLRESPSANGFQFATRCVHNLAIDTQDDNYFASCYPTNEPLVCIWDRRMITRSNATDNAFGGLTHADQQPEASLKLKDMAETPQTIWSLRFSKSRRGCLGVLSNLGHLRVYDIGREFEDKVYSSPTESHARGSAHDRPQDVYLDHTEDVERACQRSSNISNEKQRVVSFDFMTSSTKSLQPNLLLLDNDGNLRTTSLVAAPEPAIISSTGFLYKGANFLAVPTIEDASTDITKNIDKIRRNAQPRNSLKNAFKQSKQSKNGVKGHNLERRRMSSFANNSWNADLGFYEKDVTVHELLLLLAAPRLRCESGYLLNPTKNKSIASDSQWIESFWNWVERAERISRNDNMVQDHLDLSYVGVFSVWMEEIIMSSRLTGSKPSSLPIVVKNLVNRLNLPARKGCSTDYPWHRKLCLYISGLGWTREELDNMVQSLVKKNQHTKAAAMAIFADEEKLAYQALRAKSATQSHKMLAMAIAGAKHRRTELAKDSIKSKDDSEDDADNDWMESIATLAQDLSDPYARAILAYVKSGNWENVANLDALPLKYRVGVALRHLSDADLTEFIGSTTREVIANGDIEGVIFTGTGTREGLELLQSFARVFGDLQTAILGLSVGGAAGRFIPSDKTIPENRDSARKIEAFREAYRSSMMTWGLKFDRVRFDVASSRALGSSNTSHSINIPKKKEQIRLICSHCSQSLTQFDDNDELTTNGSRPVEAAKGPLTSEKAAVIGTVCPKCGRHLPRCGVCDLWLGVPDETHAKWYTNTPKPLIETTSRVPSSNLAPSPATAIPPTDQTTSMTGSVATILGPSPTPTPTSLSSKRPQQSSRHPSSSARSTSGTQPDPDPDSNSDLDAADKEKQTQDNAERKWHEGMHHFTVFCVSCAHGFHAAHARLWFDGGGTGGGGGGHRICPVPGCGCFCNG